MSKSFLKKSKASNSTRRRVELVVRRGWRPGLPPQLFYRGSRRSRLEAGKNVA